jgi:molecular chaperone DnaK
MIIEVEQTIKEKSEKLQQNDITTVEQELEKAKTTLKEQALDSQALTKATDELMQASYKIAEHLYKEKKDEKTTTQDDQHEKQNGPIDTDIS